ncbi:hypothetical protein DZJ_27500 [Dickeya ananatis]
MRVLPLSDGVPHRVKHSGEREAPYLGASGRVEHHERITLKKAANPAAGRMTGPE